MDIFEDEVYEQFTHRNNQVLSGSLFGVQYSRNESELEDGEIGYGNRIVVLIGNNKHCRYIKDDVKFISYFYCAKPPKLFTNIKFTGYVENLKDTKIESDEFFQNYNSVYPINNVQRVHVI